MAIQSRPPQGRESATTRVPWQRALPELRDRTVLLRQLRQSDATSLLDHINRPAVLQFIAPCPSTREGFERFIRWTHAERRRGRHACYGIVPPDGSAAVGIIQLWSVEREFSTAEWGFALGEAFWGTGLFERAARLFLDAVFVDAIFGSAGVFRLEARAVVHNVRGNRLLSRLGATREGILRSGFRQGDERCDQVMWSILAPEWIQLSRAHTQGQQCPVD